MCVLCSSSSEEDVLPAFSMLFVMLNGDEGEDDAVVVTAGFSVTVVVFKVVVVAMVG